MPDMDLTALLGPELAGALAGRGFAGLTSVQEAVLDPALADRDLRVTSQTGSGKTVALGLALRHLVQGETASQGGAARPRAMVVAPTRELAHQVEQELTWLYAPLGIKVVTTTGGSSARDERRALGTGPAVIVGTPGRLLDHLSRKSINPEQIAAVVLDEADRMLDLGFREDLTAILGYPPASHRTHLVSATFPHAVRALADSVQQNPAHVEGTRLGAANVDIVHRIVLVDPKEQVAAVINILLAKPEEQALVFARTRADVASLAKELAAAKFTVGSLSGEMEQAARNRAMMAFKNGSLRVLVATDVAARGIDVQDIAHVIHADAPGDADTYTHRSGRTGRAGRKGMSSVLVTPSGLRQASYLLTRAGVTFRVEPVPSADEIRKAADERLWAELSGDEGPGAEAVPDRVAALAARLAASPDVERTLSRLLLRVRQAEASEPRDVRRLEPATERPRGGERERPRGRELPHLPDRGDRSHAFSAVHPPPRSSRDVMRAASEVSLSGPHAPRPPRPARAGEGRDWRPFRVTWGANDGADARRLMAVVCRRGGIRGSDVGAIRVGSHSSTVEVAAEVAEAFAEAAAAVDPREPKVRILPDSSGAAPEAEAAPRPAPRPHPAAARPHAAGHATTGYRGAGRDAPAPAGAHKAPRKGAPYAPSGFKGDSFKPSARGAPPAPAHKGGYKGKRPLPVGGGHTAPKRTKP